MLSTGSKLSGHVSVDRLNTFIISLVRQLSRTKQHLCCDAIVKVVKVSVRSGLLSKEYIQEVRNEIKALHDENLQEIETFLDYTLKNGFSLKEWCRLKLREVTRLPLRANIKSEEVRLPRILKEYILDLAQ